MRLLNILCWLSFVGAVFLAGCQQVYEQEAVSEPEVKPTPVIGDDVPEYVSEAVLSTGGRGLWTRTRKIELDCVVTFYRADGSFYLTEQQYEIEPWSNYIRILADEPQGRVIWELSETGFEVLEGPAKSDILPMVVSERDFAEAILDITTAAVRFVDKSAMFTKMSSPVRLEGMWYYAIERVYPVERAGSVVGEKQEDIEHTEAHWSRAVFYQNRDSSLVDILWFADIERDIYLGVRGYDYLAVENRGGDLLERKGVFVPRKIEIFRTDSKTVFQERLVEVDVKKCSFTGY